MYKNLFDDTKVSRNYDDRKVTVYFNSIGSKPDEVLRRALHYAGFKNSKVRRTTFGNFNVRKYSYICTQHELDYMLEKFYHYMHDYNKDIMVLRQNMYNVYITECIKFD